MVRVGGTGLGGVERVHLFRKGGWSIVELVDEDALDEARVL